MKKKTLYIIISVVLFLLILLIYVGYYLRYQLTNGNYRDEIAANLQQIAKSTYRPEGPWIWYTVNGSYESYDISPVHSWMRLNIDRVKWPSFDNEEDCLRWAYDDMDYRQCYVNDPDDWMWFYMWDTEPRPVFKTYEECEDWAISMRPYSLLENARWGVHVVEDWVTRCSQWCHYGYRFMNRMVWTFECDKTIYSTRDHFDYFEKVFDKLEEWWSYERFENAFKSRVWCDIKLNNPKNPVYSYLVWIRFSYDLDEYRERVPKMNLKQKILKDWKIFYVEQLDWKIYVWWEIFDEGLWKVYSIKNGDENIIFDNTNWLFDDENLEIDCHWDFNNSLSDWEELYTLPNNIKWIKWWEIDDIYHWLYYDDSISN